jgi:hypothetical protein
VACQGVQIMLMILQVPIKLVGNNGGDRDRMLKVDEDYISKKKGRYTLMDSQHLDASVTRIIVLSVIHLIFNLWCNYFDLEVMFKELIMAMDEKRCTGLASEKSCTIM